MRILSGFFHSASFVVRGAMHILGRTSSIVFLASCNAHLVLYILHPLSCWVQCTYFVVLPASCVVRGAMRIFCIVCRASCNAYLLSYILRPRSSRVSDSFIDSRFFAILLSFLRRFFDGDGGRCCLLRRGVFGGWRFRRLFGRSFAVGAGGSGLRGRLVGGVGRVRCC